MEILTSKAEVREKLKNNPLQAAHLLRLNGYGSIKYTCACGETHDANGKDVSCKGSAKPFKALLANALQLFRNTSRKKSLDIHF